MHPTRNATTWGMGLLSTLASAQVTISGTFKSVPPGSEVAITCYNNPIERDELAVANAKLDEHGSFSVTFPWDKPGEAQLQVADQYTQLFLSPGDSLHLRCDYAHFDSTLQYTGRGAAENNYMAADVLAAYGNKASQGTAAFDDAGKFTAFVDSLEQLNGEMLRTRENAHWSEAFRRYITTTTRYRFVYPRWMFLITYDQGKQAFVRREVPAAYYDFLKSLDIHDQQAADNDEYNGALSYYVSELYDGNMKFADSLADAQKQEMWIIGAYTNRRTLFQGKLRDFQLTKFIEGQLGQYGAHTALIDSLITDYKAFCTTPDYVAIIDKIHAAAVRVMPGQPAPDFTLADTAGHPVRLADLKGKVVFIDFWATWCAPCLVSMPKVKEMEEQFKDRSDVVFLKVNVRDDGQRWKDFVRKRKLGGTNLFADGDHTKALFKAYNFDGIPHFVLVGKDGKLVDAATYPGEEATAKLRAALAR